VRYERTQPTGLGGVEVGDQPRAFGCGRGQRGRAGGSSPGLGAAAALGAQPPNQGAQRAAPRRPPLPGAPAVRERDVGRDVGVLVGERAGEVGGIAGRACPIIGAVQAPTAPCFANRRGTIAAARGHVVGDLPPLAGDVGARGAPDAAQSVDLARGLRRRWPGRQSSGRAGRPGP
jgi:hypothetical protein